MITTAQKREILLKVHAGEFMMPNLTKGTYLPIIESGISYINVENIYFKFYNQYQNGTSIKTFAQLLGYAEAEVIQETINGKDVDFYKSFKFEKLNLTEVHYRATRQGIAPTILTETEFKKI